MLPERKEGLSARPAAKIRAAFSEFNHETACAFDRI